MSIQSNLIFVVLTLIILINHLSYVCPLQTTSKWSQPNKSITTNDSNNNNNKNNSYRNQQLLRHKIGPGIGSKRRLMTTTTTPSTDEDDRSFCTLANFQNCISELWPGSGPTSSSTNSAASPTERVNANTETEQIDETEDLKTPSSSYPSGSDFPTTYNELKATCSELKDRVRCLDRHSERCFTPEMMQVFGHIVTNAKQFVHDLCDNKRVQSGMSTIEPIIY